LVSRAQCSSSIQIAGADLQSVPIVWSTGWQTRAIWVTEMAAIPGGGPTSQKGTDCIPISIGTAPAILILFFVLIFFECLRNFSLVMIAGMDKDSVAKRESRALLHKGIGIVLRPVHWCGRHETIIACKPW
jgi:hypothetical protein